MKFVGRKFEGEEIRRGMIKEMTEKNSGDLMVDNHLLHIYICRKEVTA